MTVSEKNGSASVMRRLYFLRYSEEERLVHDCESWMILCLLVSATETEKVVARVGRNDLLICEFGGTSTTVVKVTGC